MRRKYYILPNAMISTTPPHRPVIVGAALNKIIFHSLGKLLCKIIFVYYKLHGPTVILGVLSLTVVLLQSLCSFCTNNDMKRENWTLPTVIRNTHSW